MRLGPGGALSAAAFVTSLVTLAALAGCRNGCAAGSGEASVSGDGDGGASPEGAPDEAASAEDDPRQRELLRRAHDAAVDPACEGTSIALLGVLLDPRCRASEREWSAAMRLADGGALANAVHQEATREGEKIAFSLVNRGKVPVIVPLRVRPGAPELPAFSAFAEDAAHRVYELAAPVADELAGASADHVYSACMRLVPSAEAHVRLTVDPRVVRRLSPPCPPPPASDGGRDASTPCAPERLPPGRYALYVGQLLSGFDSGAPVRISWEF